MSRRSARRPPEPDVREPEGSDAPGLRIIPAGYLLTTHFLRLSYLADHIGCREQPHTHSEHVVIWPERSSATVDVEGVQWSLSVGRGVWIPAGVPHTASRALTTPLTATYVEPSAVAGRDHPGQVTSVVVNAATRELLLHLSESPMPRDQRLRAQRVCLELMTAHERPTIELPLPRDPRIARIARMIVQDPADDRSIEQWARITSQSARTIARAFRVETGLTFSQWRTRARLARAVQLLGEGTPVGAVARRVGYATNSAFTATFHRVLKQRPRDFLPHGRASAG
ncbi:helix-turn-helix domain-containing protein [Microbacterium marinilacus]|uniref:Helix-turn-helix transcriptional regulator n=1 Tax=Microbacterium marinilacus TaxID=415209 RepID=A0ABP7BCX4_9MICO|nr:AraC family transcriptional regulator [Microbacterium marinilacus]MBY0689313.1 AraC family transcriptional regulator [Microbacterium marinilacus]